MIEDVDGLCDNVNPLSYFTDSLKKPVHLIHVATTRTASVIPLLHSKTSIHRNSTYFLITGSNALEFYSTVISVDLPDQHRRKTILQECFSQVCSPTSPDLDLLVKSTQGFTPAELLGLQRSIFSFARLREPLQITNEYA